MAGDFAGGDFSGVGGFAKRGARRVEFCGDAGVCRGDGRVCVFSTRLPGSIALDVEKMLDMVFCKELL
jgi:hypothetical protein